ncbi:DUF4595 domain-containing protein [Pedobacter sp. HDW13]|uniref:DUF4595 domain-containing protein n=1 Tax=Pedobacter sp. HDW13 TaxID=2714940 RepID=UPI00140BB4FB|nr:DUF4595 domain-containing protein [Pedobacter sp. HDW13]QIL38098.1 DUF4595 domain-containing protein [Pedobacter sp. HDW13]
MRKSLSLMLLATTLIVASCKKGTSDEEVQPQSNCQLSQSSYSTGSDTGKILYTYNSDGKVSKVVYDSEDYQETYTYTSTQITKVVKDGNYSRTYTYTLNTQGRVTTETQMAGDYKIDYTYNTEGYLIESIRTNLLNSSTVSTKYTFTDGNLTKIVSPTLTINIVYGGFLTMGNYFNNMDSDLPTFYKGILRSYFGKGSKYEIASVSYNGAAYTEGFSYEKDTNGNITKVTMKASDNKGYTIINTFNCK